MSRFRLSILLRICITALMLALSLPISSAAQTQGNTYSSPEFGFTVEWTNDWDIAVDGVQDYGITLVSENSMVVNIEGYDGQNLPSDLLAPMPGETTMFDDRTGDPARVIYETEDGIHTYLESYPIDNGAVSLVVSIATAPEMLPDVVEYVREEITVNGNPAISGAAIGGSEQVEATQPTEPAQTSGVQSFTGPVYGYTVSYDSAVWTLGSEIQEGNVDGIQLTRDGTTFTIWAWDNYGNDPVMCLEREEAYYSQEVAAISDWEPAIGADGQPLRHESANLAWGLFNLTYTTESGTSGALIDYISCEPIPGQDAVLIVLLSSNPRIFDTEFELALDVLDTLQFAESSGQETTAATVEAETPESATIEIDTNLDGSQYESPNYGFTATIPLQWQVLEESIEGTNELLVVGNGTSVVTLWATQDYRGDLAGCVDFAANASGLDLRIDRDDSGGDFRGVYRNEAFANFTYMQDGTQMMYFINCQAIPDTDGFLILIHDVEYDLFTSERRFRSEIENSITMP